MRPNFLLIGIDTLRADHLGCYGYVRNTSPNLDRLARKGVVFKKAFAPAIPTHPGWTSILTGAHPLRHKILTHMGDVQLSKDIPMVQEVLRKHGYETGAVDNMFLKYGAFYDWFTRGFKEYMHPGAIPAPEAGLKVQADAVNRMALEWLSKWLEKPDRRPFFLFLHYWDPHAPYKPPEPYDSMFWKLDRPDEETEKEFRDYVVSQYDGEIAYADAKVGELLEFLESRNLLDETMIIVVSDHGEDLREHTDVWGHKGLFDNVTRVPLIISYPSELPENKVVEALVQHVDIAPTILEAAGVEPPPTVYGRSLKPLIQGEVESIYSEVILMENSQEKARALRTERWKLIVSLGKDFEGRPAGWLRLYNLEKDPGETINLALHEAELSGELKERLEKVVNGILKGEPDPLLEQPVRSRRIKFYSEARSLIELYGLIKREMERG